jgi:hypothetical protein
VFCHKSAAWYRRYRESLASLRYDNDQQSTGNLS